MQCFVISVTVSTLVTETSKCRNLVRPVLACRVKLKTVMHEKQYAQYMIRLTDKSDEYSLGLCKQSY
jgi:hypothetical protein